MRLNGDDGVWVQAPRLQYSACVVRPLHHSMGLSHQWCGITSRVSVSFFTWFTVYGALLWHTLLTVPTVYQSTRERRPMRQRRFRFWMIGQFFLICSVRFSTDRTISERIALSSNMYHIGSYSLNSELWKQSLQKDLKVLLLDRSATQSRLSHLVSTWSESFKQAFPFDAIQREEKKEKERERVWMILAPC